MFRKMEDNILFIDNLDTKIYRIFSYEHFIKLFKERMLVLVSPSKWDDPFENFFLKTKVRMDDGIVASLESLYNHWYGLCWTLNEDTDAMWRIYSKNKNGIRVSTTVRKLFQPIYESYGSWAGLKCFIGKVEYKEKEEILSFMRDTTFWDIASGGQNDGFAKLLCIKRTAFEHENEIRLLISEDVAVENKGLLSLDFDPNTVFDDICLDPRLSDFQLQDVKESIRNLGCHLDIFRSDLYQCNLPVINM